MTIIRSPEKITTGFLIADKRNTENRKLSWGARGLLVFLLGKPDNWSVIIEHLIDQTKESAKPTGRDGVYSLLNELITEGYVIRKQARLNGKMNGYDYIVYSTPQTDLPCTDNTDTEKPYAANPLLISNDFDQENNLTKNDFLISKTAAACDKNGGDMLESQNPLISENDKVEDKTSNLPTLINGFKDKEENQGQSQNVKTPIKKEKNCAKKESGPTTVTNPITGELIPITESLKSDLWAFIQSDGYWTTNKSCKTATAALKFAITTAQRPRGLMNQFFEHQASKTSKHPSTQTTTPVWSATPVSHDW
jgi:hypothetical protein